MKFKIGDKVKLTKKYLNSLNSYYINQLKNGGIIIEASRYSARIKFYSGYIYRVNNTDLESTKNRQLLFNFMDAVDST